MFMHDIDHYSNVIDEKKGGGVVVHFVYKNSCLSKQFFQDDN